MTSGVFCTYNAFTRSDFRVRFEVPGKIESTTVHGEGEAPTKADEWQEVFVSSTLRALHLLRHDAVGACAASATAARGLSRGLQDCLTRCHPWW